MEQKIKEIIRQVGDIGEKVSRLLAEENPASIEIDIILGDIRALYEDMSDLRSGTTIPAGGKSRKTKPPAPDKEPDKTISAAGEKSAQTIPPEQETPDEGNAPSKEATAGAATAEAGKTPKPGTENKLAGPAILADKYKGEKKFINESLVSSRGKQDIGSKIQSKPIRDIGSSMGINDRFKLINELFNGDKDSFQNTISTLDGASNFNEAFNYITTSFDWDMEEDSVQMLLELVRRKFIVNQNE